MTESHTDMHKIRIPRFFFENRLHWQFEVEKISPNGCFRVHNYLRINKTLVRTSSYELG